MEIIIHRRNSLDELKAAQKNYGVEVDIRSSSKKLIVSHDPFMKDIFFERWLSSFCHGTLIVNIKEEGLESYILELLREHRIENFFFLDQTFPYLVKHSRLLNRKCAVRFSEFESIETAINAAQFASWVWVDYFTRFPLSLDYYKILKELGYKICIVSPELHGHNPDTYVPELRSYINANLFSFDAVCTKRPDLWRYD